ncbi:MAG: N-acetylmuramoyl-L-alanine amidase [Propionibacteriaceae bacterium]|nr:N-acetylmuramoyl-L-alanine amidase [Propionibacteriaceae bacterium]
MAGNSRRTGPLGRVSRRTVLGAGVGTAAALGSLAGGSPAAYAQPGRPAIRPRADWAGGLAAKGAIAAEDVRFLIIHHSESPNSERPGSIPGRLRSFFNYHTGTKQWPDVAYNFFVDPFGEIWEGRSGSLAGPVRGDATGGSQGYAQLCCFVGDHTAQVPTDAAMAAMTALVAWLAGRYDIDLGAGKAIRFTSRGSNRWSRGTEVTTDPLVGHRDMSQTACPGDALYPLIQSRILPGAQALLGRSAGSGSTPTTSSPRDSATLETPAPPASSSASTAPATPSTSAAPTPGEPAPSSTPPAAVVEQPGLVDRLGDMAVPVAVGAGVLGAAAVAGGVVIATKDR